MKKMNLLVLAMAISLLGGGVICGQQEESIRLLIRSDDIGSSHAANVACIESYKNGITRSVEVMVPCAWFDEACRMLRDNPGLDVGVHLCLTSEWDNVKWGPITRGASLSDERGYFYPATSQRNNYPPNTGFLEAKPDLKEVEMELRAQIEIALKYIPQVSHLSSHMGTPTCTPQLRAIVEKLSKEYKLPIGTPGAKRAGGFGGTKTTPLEKEEAMLGIINRLGPGVWLFVEHPGLDTPEMRAIGHEGYRHVAADRVGVTRALTSEKVKKAIERRSVELISHADFYRILKEDEKE